MSVFGGTFLVFLTLKLIGIITWPWVWVTSPLWIWLIIVIIYFIIRYKK